jgi:3-oxoacyl-[acyl-carrier-protein] synthase II
VTRAVITGIGALTPVGLSVSDTWTNLLAGRSGVRPLTRLTPPPILSGSRPMYRASILSPS